MLRYTRNYFGTVAYPVVGFKVGNLADSLILPDVTKNSVILYPYISSPICTLTSPTYVFTNKKFLRKYPVHNFVTIEMQMRGCINYKEICEDTQMIEYTDNLYQTMNLIHSQNKYTINTNNKVKTKKHVVPFACIFDAYIDEIIIRKKRGPRVLNPQLFVLNTKKNSCDQTCITHIFEVK
jgi:hypothetical protein